METEKNLRFSVIMCAYNLEKLVGAAIDSVLKQKFENYELIIVNDGSKDNTLNVLKKYQAKSNGKIRIIDNEKNIGLSASRNVAIAQAKGEYIVHLDGDDTLYDKTTLKKIDETIGDRKSDIVYFGVQYVGGSNKAYIPNAQNSTREARIVCDMHFAVASKVWRREFLEKNNMTFIEGMYYEDMVYSIKGAILAEDVNYGEFPIYVYYRNREGSIMATPNMARCKDMYKMLYYLMDLYEITPQHLKPYLMSFIKNETLSVPMRLDAILKSFEDNTKTPVIPKRNYVFTEAVPSVVNGMPEVDGKPKLIPLVGGQNQDQNNGITINTEIPMTAAADSITDKKGIEIKFNN